MVDSSLEGDCIGITWDLCLLWDYDNEQFCLWFIAARERGFCSDALPSTRGACFHPSEGRGPPKWGNPKNAVGTKYLIIWFLLFPLNSYCTRLNIAHAMPSTTEREEGAINPTPISTPELEMGVSKIQIYSDSYDRDSQNGASYFFGNCQIAMFNPRSHSPKLPK